MVAEQLMVQSAIGNWTRTIQRVSSIFTVLPEAKFYETVAPGRNRLIYLLGHLTASNDGMLPLLGFGTRLYPAFEEIFLHRPDLSVDPLPSPAELLRCWLEVTNQLQDRFTSLTPSEWVQRHQAMSDDEYAKDPGRNRFAVLLNRTSHASFHLGQIVLATK